MGIVEGLTTLLLAAAVIPAVPAWKARSADLWEVLGAPGPEPAWAGRMGLYAPLLGSWRVEVVDYGEGGAKRTQVGEWRFDWVLEGRAIQDVLVVPARGERRPGEEPRPGNRCGTSIRVYDPKEDLWHVSWFNPVTGKTNRLEGRKAGEDIVQEGVDDDGSLIRWSFREITARSFHWLGEDSRDGGKSWHLSAEFFGTRLE